MDTILYVNEEFNENFDFSKLSLASPSALQGGSYFTQILYKNKSLYLQLPQCKTRKGIIKTEKKIYTDLIFENNNNNDFIKWLENFELHTHKLIYEKKDLWFHNNFDMDDIETIFTSPMKIFKSGKYVLVRSFIPNARQIKKLTPCMVYNEQEVKLSLNDITDTKSIIPLISIDGINFSSRSFQIDITLNQVMMLDDIPDINSFCAIKKGHFGLENTNENSSNLGGGEALEIKSENIIKKEHRNEGHIIAEEKNEEEDDEKQDDEKQVIPEEENNECENKELTSQEDVKKIETNTKTLIAENNGGEEEEKSRDDSEEKSRDDSEEKSRNDSEEKSRDDSEEKSRNDSEEKNNENTLEEVEFNFDDMNEKECIALKKPKEVYYQIYKTARAKANLTRKAAIDAYLEARNIKTKYMLDDIEDSEDEYSQDEYSQDEFLEQ